MLCEKPLVPSLAVARELVTLARERRVFLMEALWTRFLPIYARVRDWLSSGAIGRVQAIQSSFCFHAPFDPGSRLFNADLAGGSLLDIGIYNVAMTRWVLESALGACPDATSLRAEGILAPTGVDQRAAGTILFPGGVVSQFVCALDGTADNSLRIFGDRGWIRLEAGFWEATEATLFAARPATRDGAGAVSHQRLRGGDRGDHALRARGPDGERADAARRDPGDRRLAG